MKILLAEDDAINRLIAERMLKRAGHTVVCAANGQEAVDAAASEGFDLILMDCEMPVLDGYAAVRLIREREREGSGSRTVIFALTAHSSYGDCERFRVSGMDGSLPKPLNLKELERLLSNHMRPEGAD